MIREERRNRRYAGVLMLLAVFSILLILPVPAEPVAGEEDDTSAQATPHVVTQNLEGEGTGNITGIIFNDMNGNGVQDPGEQGLAGWTILLVQEEDFLLTVTTTDADGSYSFGHLRAGQYGIGEVHRAGWTQTVPQSGSCSLSITGGQTVTGQDFGNHRDPSPVPIPEFPRAYLPATLGIGFLGAALVLARTREP
jgi:hypothetical protein